jgi:hypothetical protein
VELILKLTPEEAATVERELVTHKVPEPCHSES